MSSQNQITYQANIWWGTLSDSDKEFYRQVHYPYKNKSVFLTSHVIRNWLYEKYGQTST